MIRASGAPPGTTTADVPCPADRSDGRELLDGGGVAGCGDVALVFVTLERVENRVDADAAGDGHEGAGGDDDGSDSWAVRLDGTRWMDAPVPPSSWRGWASVMLAKLHERDDLWHPEARAAT